MKSTDRVRYNYYSIDFACVSIEFITNKQTDILKMKIKSK